MQSSLTLRPIGFIATQKQVKFQALHQPSEDQPERNVLELLPEPGYQQALQDLAGFSRVWLLWWFHRNASWRPLVLPPDLYEGWLDPQAPAEQLLAEVRARSQGLKLDVYPTSPLGNNVRFEGPEVVARLSPERLAELRAERAKIVARPASAQQNLFGEPAAPKTSRARRGR